VHRNPTARNGEAELAFIAARDTWQPVYSRPFKDANGMPVFQTHVPLLNGGVFVGALVVEYSIEALIRHFVPPEVARRRAISVLDDRANVLASTVMPMPQRQRAPIVHDVPLTVGQRRGVARQWLHQLAWSATPILDGVALCAHAVDAARHLAPHEPAPADAEHAGVGNQLPARDGELDADRHARNGHGRAHHLRQPGLLRVCGPS
jgi:hypothetical protein